MTRTPRTSGGKPLRLLIVLPSWVGDAVMATPVLRRLRQALPGSFIGALARPGIDELLAGTDCVDEFHVERASGVMGPKLVAGKIRPRRYDAAFLLTNSFSTALVTRLAGIPRRVGYDRDGRGLLLTGRIEPRKSGLRTYALESTVTYYWRAADAFLESCGIDDGRATREDARVPVRTPTDLGLPEGVFLELSLREEDRERAALVLAKGGVSEGEKLAVLNPGGNNPAKRWPAERYAALADALADRHALTIILNGSPAERDLCAQIAEMCKVARCVRLPDLGITLGALKGVVARAKLMVTNDTGPRHIAAALGVPVISLFGPTDHRWTIIPCRGGEMIIPADPTLPEDQVANEHPERCGIERIGLERVLEGVERVVGGE